MTQTVAMRLVANGEAMIAETNRAFNVMTQNGKAMAKQLGTAFSDDLKEGARAAEVAIRASFKSINDVMSSAKMTNGAIQFDVAGAKAATAAAQERLQILQAMLKVEQAAIAQQGQATAANRAFVASLEESVRVQTQNVAALTSQEAALERLQGAMGQTAVQQGKVTAVSGQTRAGMQQLSFQVSDVAASFANGVSPMVIFAQQSGQVIQALSMMSTRATGFLAIMGNPWVLAITSALTVLGTLAYNHYKAGDASEAQGKKEKSLTERIHEQNVALRENIKLQGDKLRATAITTKAEVGEATRELNSLLAQQAEAKKLFDILRTPRKGYAPNTDAIEAATERYNDLTEQVKKATKAVKEGVVNVRGAEAALIEREVAASLDKQTAALHKMEDAKGKLREQQLAGTISNEKFRESIKANEEAYKAEVEGIKATEKAHRELNKEREKAAKLPAVTMNEVAGLIGFKPNQINSGKRTPAQNKAAKGAANSYHLIGQAIDLPLTLNGQPLTKAGIRAALEPAGVIIKELLGPGDRGHSDHFHVAFDVKRGTPDKMADMQAKADEDAAAAVERREKAYKAISDQISADIDNLKTIAAVEKLRSEGREREAAEVEALAQLRGRYGELLAGEPTVAAKTLGITEEQVKVLRDQLTIAEKLTTEGIKRKKAQEDADYFWGVTEKAVEDGNKRLEQMREDQKREAERQFQDIAGFWERAMRSGGKSIWSDFKNQGRRALADLAAQATISFLGNIGGGGVGSRGGGIGGLFSGITQMFGSSGGVASSLPGMSALGPFAAAVAGNQMISSLLGNDQIKNGKLFGTISPFLTAILGSAKKGSATLAFTDGSLGVGATRGNSRSRIEAATNGVNSLADMLSSIAEELGGSISGAGSVSIGMRKKSYVVDPTGQGRTKGKGVLKFKTEQEAIEAAFRDALSDGVINGISAASQRILQAGGDVQKAIEKAAMIESIPKALKARMNPVGAALEELNAKWDKMIAALKEGGATAEQMADAEKLYRLEREEAMKAANDNLKDFIDSLNFGSSSNYSLPDQLAKLRVDLDMYLGKIAAGDFAGVDQQRYLQLAGEDLGILREIAGSGAGYFNRVDELRTATQRLADGLSATSAEAARDPFAQATAANTQATAEILTQQTTQLSNIERYLSIMATGSGGANGFIGADRSFVSAA